MMKQATVLASLVSVGLSQITATCKNIVFDSPTVTLSADCVPRNQQGYISSALNLNDCFGYDGTNITATYHGNFGESCDSCRMFTAPDPWYRFDCFWVGCTCDGQSIEASAPIEVAVAHQYVTNDDGHLRC